MLLIAGIIPLTDLPLVTGRVSSEKNQLKVAGHYLPGGQGTAAMVSAALEVTQYLGVEEPHVVLAGDTGSGEGSRLVYQYLIDNLVSLEPQVVALHYWMPDLILMRELCNVVKRVSIRPVMIADAASMYTAKACGLASEFDLYTPDSSEIAFLADPEAIHPAYINKHLFQPDDNHMELIETAYKNSGASRILLVKGKRDLIANEQGIIATVDEPDVPAMECIGGTGDTITGMCAALSFSGMSIEQSAMISAAANRLTGQIANVNPASTVRELIQAIPTALNKLNIKQPNH